MELLLRLASPLQTWAGYRVGHSTVSTGLVPSTSGVAGLLGACLGVRDYQALIPRFALRVRVDRINTPTEDLQVAVPPAAGRDTELWHRTWALHEATRTIRAGAKVKPYRPAKQINITGGDNRVQYSPHRTFLPHAEFTCSLQVEEGFGAELRAAFARPAHMPYLGRMANPISFPFYLGFGKPGMDALAVLPHVLRHDEDRSARSVTLRVHEVTGDYARQDSRIEHFEVPAVRTRREQLDWIKEHLDR